jgi:large subunit ribosomal protein L9
MEVLLLDDVEGLGAKGANVRVADGYARNYLLPRRLAIRLSPKASQVYQELERQRSLRERNLLRQAEEEAARLAAVQVTIPAQANEEDTLFGSITSADVAEALARAGHPVDKRQIEMEDHMKRLGVYDVTVRVRGGVTAAVKVWVVRA